MKRKNGKHSGLHRAGAMPALLLLLVAQCVGAESIYKCRDASGHLAFQDHACANTQQESRVDIAKAPPPSASPEYGLASPAHTLSPRASSTRTSLPHTPARKASHRHGDAAREAVSFECRAGNGDVFYRHSGCPKSIKAGGASARGDSRHVAPVAVSAAPLPRSEACKRLAAGGLGRAGHDHDEQVSTYDRNAGRDPCRRF
jgi:hypothetical protein